MKQLISAMSCSVFALGFFALFGQQIAPVWSVEAKTKAAPTCRQKCASTRAECFKNNPKDKKPCVQKYVACMQDCLSASLQRSKTVCLDFEPPRWTLGTQYGVPASQAPGTRIFTLNRIRASVHNFVLASGSHTFNLAKVDVAPQPISNGQSLRLNNINVEFDFRQLGFRSAAVEFKFLDLGGLENLAVNGQPVPEPATLAVFGLGALALALRKRRN